MQYLRDVTGYTEWDWLTGNGVINDSVWQLRETLRVWWRLRPRLIECSFCRQKIWWNGIPRDEAYCSESCAFYGPYDKDCSGCGKPVNQGDHSDCVPF